MKIEANLNSANLNVENICGSGLITMIDSIFFSSFIYIVKICFD